MPQCEFPLCKRFARKGTFCVNHSIFEGVKVEDKPKARIKNRSKKMEVSLRVHIPAVKKFLSLPENKNCQIKMEGCQGKAVCVHHSAGRIGVKLHDQEDWVASCLRCNLTVEILDLQARKLGFKKSKFLKDVS